MQKCEVLWRLDLFLSLDKGLVIGESIEMGWFSHTWYFVRGKISVVKFDSNLRNKMNVP